MALLNYPKTHIGTIFLFFCVSKEDYSNTLLLATFKPFLPILGLVIPFFRFRLQANDFLDRDSSLRLALASSGRNDRDCHFRSLSIDGSLDRSRPLEMSKPTYRELATNFTLWCKFVLLEEKVSEREFNETPIDEKLDILQGCSGPRELRIFPTAALTHRHTSVKEWVRFQQAGICPSTDSS
jgi:hypothetical protein